MRCWPPAARKCGSASTAGSGCLLMSITSFPKRRARACSAIFRSAPTCSAPIGTLRNGPVSRWNRPVHAVADGKPHLRVENRVLPAGPTLTDVLANAAFYYGLVHELAEAEPPVWTQMPFAAAAANLAAGARRGLEAVVFWPGYGDVPVTDLTLRHLLPLAARGPERWCVDSADATRRPPII